jgi:hypothetical protein
VAKLPADFPILSAQWTAPDRIVHALTFAPRECAKPPTQAAQRQLLEIGRAAFRAPLLLGGQAARAGLSCSSCHSNGRRNDAFLFPGLSDQAGTADVTSSIMSSHRGDGRFDPKPIPDLAVSRKISRDPGKQDLETFINGLITLEFDGASPPPLILKSVGVYVRSIDQRFCPARTEEPIRLADRLNDADRAIVAASYAWQLGDAGATRLLVLAARSTLGQINERLEGEALAAARDRLHISDLALLGIEQAIDRNSPDVPTRLASWRSGQAVQAPYLRRAERQSLFNPDRLAQRLQRNER